MALIDLISRRIHGKIVYYGPGFGGKTTNLRYVHGHVRNGAGHELRAIADETGRTIFCDVLPLDLGTIRGFAMRYDLYTVPGQALSGRTRTAVFNGADGVVFVADAQSARLSDNLQSFKELTENIARQGKRSADFPIVLQYNKMDLPDVLPAPVLDRHLNAAGAPQFEAVAVTGAGVAATLRAICKLVTSKL